MRGKGLVINMSDSVLMYPESYQWKWVCAQHPMVLIGADQSSPRALETVPPWGGNDVRGYCLKMYEMMKKVLDTPEMKIDFDLSAKELLMFLEEFPEAKEMIDQLLKEKRLGFVGCDYAQAHYHEARSESALRQLRYGEKIFREVLGIRADTFMHQETGLFENLPQLLAAYGIKKAAIHRFTSAFEFLETPALEICSNFGQLELVRNETFARWCGLDGTCLPIYLPIVQNHLSMDLEVAAVFNEQVTDPDFKETLMKELPAGQRKYPTNYEENRGLYRNGSIIIECPDLVEVNDDYIADRKRVGTFWLMSEALDEELKTATRMPKIRYYTYWSYCEGEFGEKMFKAYRSTEQALLAAETMQVLTGLAGRKIEPFDADTAWDQLLSAQHHDINWYDTQELKDAYIAQMDQAAASAASYIKLASEAVGGTSDKDSRYVTVFNTLPVARRQWVSVDVPGRAYRVFDQDQELPSQMQDGKLCFEARMDGLGYRSFRLEPKLNEEKEIVITGPYQFENDVMRVTILPDGRISSLCSKLSGERLNGFGNLLKGRLTHADKSTEWISNEDTGKRAVLYPGALYDRLMVEGEMGTIPYKMMMKLPHGACQTIDFDLDVTFDHHEMGDFYHDESKLCLYWDLAQDDSDILIDEPFGVVKSRQDRPLHPANAIAVTERGKGLVYEHTGTPKTWVSDGQLVNLLAWGSNNFTNRSPWGWSTFEIYDLRLNGTSSYHYSISIAENDDPVAFSRKIIERITPPVAVLSPEAVEEKTFLTIGSENIIPTAVEPAGDEMIVRMFDVSGRDGTVLYSSELELPEKTDVAGNHGTACLDTRPYEVFELRFR